MIENNIRIPIYIYIRAFQFRYINPKYLINSIPLRYIFSILILSDIGDNKNSPTNFEYSISFNTIPT